MTNVPGNRAKNPDIFGKMIVDSVRVHFAANWLGTTNGDTNGL